MMKKLLVSMLVLLMALTACTTTGGTETEEPTATATEETLPPAPTAIEEPTAEPTATDEPTSTSEPEPTETAVPTETPTEEAEAEQTPTMEAPQSEGAIPVDVEIPEGAVIVFTQTGGFMGLEDTWVFYPDGRVTLNEVEQTQLTLERIDELVNDLALQGFFETTYITEPHTFCCDFFDYTLAVQTAENQNYVSYSDGDPNLPQNLFDITTLMREIIEEAQIR